MGDKPVNLFTPQNVREYGERRSMKWIKDPVVTIKVGISKTSFVVHKSLLLSVSAYFKAAFTGSFKEAQENVLELPEDEPAVFELFVEYLYYGTIPCLHGFYHSGFYRSGFVTTAHRVHDLSNAVNIWRFCIFAEEKQVKYLSTIVCDELIYHQTIIETPEATLKQFLVVVSQHVYNNTTAESHIRKSLIIFCTTRLRIEDVFRSATDVGFPTQFLLDLLGVCGGKLRPETIDNIKLFSTPSSPNVALASISKETTQD